MAESDTSKPSDDPIIPPRRKPRVWPVRLGVALTVVWLAVVFVVSLSHPAAWSGMTPNTWGDFLAGVFAPLAFLWLALGFFQQGEELRHSADALWVQGEELRNAVTQQKRLVEVTSRNNEFDEARYKEEKTNESIKAQPVLRISAGTSSRDGIELTNKLRIVNEGPTCTDLMVRFEGLDIPDRKLASLRAHQDWAFSVSFLDDEQINGTVHVDYVDALHSHQSIAFAVTHVGDFLQFNKLR